MIFEGFPSKIQTKADLDEVLLYGAENDASDAFLIAREPVFISRYKKNHPLSTRRLKDSEISAILLHTHSQEAEAILKGGEPLDYSYDLWKGESRYRFRVNAVPTRFRGHRTARITFRSISFTPPTHQQLGIETEILAACKNAAQGLIVVSGATGQGKSSTLAAILRDRLEDPDAHEVLVTAESPIEYVYDDVDKGNSLYTQLEVGRDVSTWGRAIENMLRMHPTSILVGESRDVATISSSITAALTGHTTYTTLHANSNAAAAQRVVNMFPSEQQNQIKTDFFQATQLMVAQRLMRTVTGGLTAIREVLEVDQQVRDFIISSDNPEKATFEATERWGKPMIEDINSKYKEGIITEDEYKMASYNYSQDKANLLKG